MFRRIKNARISLLCMLVILLMCLGGCGNTEKQVDDKIKIVCTMFPQYDWVRSIVGDNENVSVEMLIKNGGDLHNYQPTADDIITVSDCDMFIYVGGTSDGWVEDILAQSDSEDIIVINMMDVIGDNALLSEEVKSAEEIEEHHHEDCEHAHSEYDEHIWLSISNAKLVCKAICDSLIQLDATNKAVYTANFDSYVSKLDELDGKYKECVKNAKHDTILVADRFPFLYLTREYGINYYAAFGGCSSETEASFETVLFLADRLDEHNLKAIVCVDGSTQNVAKTVIETNDTKDQTIYTLDSLQAVSRQRVDNGETYLSIMENNLVVLSEILN